MFTRQQRLRTFAEPIDDFGADEAFLQNVIAPLPVAAPAPAPAPYTPPPIAAPPPAPYVAPQTFQPRFSIMPEQVYEDFGSDDSFLRDVAAPTPAPPPAWEPLAQQIASQWQQYGINPDIKGINRANELAQILTNYGITDLSKIGLKETPYEEMRVVSPWAGEGGPDTEELYKGTRGQLTYGDQTFGRLGGFGSGGEKEFAAPQEFLQQSDPGRYGLSYSAAGKGWTEFEVVPGPGGKPVIVPKWGSSSDVTPELIQFLALAATPFTGGLSGALGGGLAGQIGAQALISGGLGGLSAAAQGEDILEGALRGGVGGALTAGIGSLVAPAANAVSSSVLSATDSQLLADIASGAVKGGAGALPGAIMSGDFGNVLTGAVSGGVGSGVGSALEDIKFSDNVKLNDAIIQGAQGLANEAVKAGLTGQDINVAGALTPAIAQGISDEFKLPVKQVTAGLQVASKLLQGGDLSLADILKLGTSLSSSGTKPAAGKEASAGYGGADPGYFDEEKEILGLPSWAIDPYAEETQSVPVTGQRDPYFPEFEEALLTQEPVVPTTAPPPDQRVEVAAPLPPAAFDLPEEVLSSLSPAPQPRPISELERVLFQEANVMPDTAQQVVTTGDKQEPLLPDLLETVVPPPAPEEPRYIDVTEGQPQQVEITGGGPSLGNLLADLGLVTKLPETPVIPPEDIPAIVAPPVEAPTIPAPAPAAPPAAAPAAAPAPAPAPKKQDDLALLMMLAAMMTPQQKEEEQYQLAQILGVDSPFGRIV